MKKIISQFVLWLLMFLGIFLTPLFWLHSWMNAQVQQFIHSFSDLTLMLAQVCDYQPGDFVHTLGDAHLYSNHFEQARLQLERPPRPLPTMRLNPEVKDLFAFRFEDFTLEGYDPHPHIAAPIAV